MKMRNGVLKFSLALVMFAALQAAFSARSFANGKVWEQNVTTDPTAVESISGSNFAATAAFRDWAQTQSVSSGAGLSLGFETTNGGIGTPSTTASVYLANFLHTAQTNVNVTAGSYIAMSFGTVGANYTVTINSTYVSDYHASYHETNATDHTGYLIIYFKLKGFTINYDTNPTAPDVKLADIDAGTVNATGITIGNVNHTDFMDEGTDPNGNTLVSSGLLDSTPEIPPNAIPALYTGLGTLLWFSRQRMSVKAKKKDDKTR